MTRIYELESEEFNRIAEGNQTFISLRDDKIGIKSDDTLVLQDVPEDGVGLTQMVRKVEFTYYEGLKQGWVICSLKEPSNS